MKIRSHILLCGTLAVAAMAASFAQAQEAAGTLGFAERHDHYQRQIRYADRRERRGLQAAVRPDR